MVGLETTDAGGFRDPGVASDPDSDMAGGTPAEAEDDLSPEESAWVDSCLVEGDGDGGEGMGADRMSDDAWASLTEAFIDALAYSASGNATAIPEEEKVDESCSSSMDTGREAPGENASSHELMSQANGSQMARGSFQADAALDEEEPSSPTASTYAATFYEQPSPTLGDSSGSAPSDVAGGEFEATGEGLNSSSSSSSSNGRLDAASVVLGNEFPEDHQVYGDGEDEDEFSIAEGGEELGEVELTSDIFRVWELDVTEDEENEEEDEEQFGWQLKKALEGSSVGAAVMPPSVADDPSTAIWEDEEWKTGAVLDDEKLEQLIAGITDISLGRPSSDA